VAKRSREELLHSVACYLAAGTRGEAAALRGLSPHTLDHHILAAKREWPELFAGNLKRAGTVTDLELGAAAFHAWISAGRNASAAARATGVNESTMRRNVQRFMSAVGMAELPELPPSLGDDLAEHRDRQDSTTHKARYRDAIKLIDKLSERCKALEWAAKASFEPAEWTLQRHESKHREHIPHLLTSDFQIGEVIDAAETEAGYGYSTEIFCERYRQMIDTTIYLSTEHGGKGWEYPGMIYARGGDTISGGIHPELADTDDKTPIEAVEVAFEEESAGIEKLAEAFGRVEVKMFGAGGNHDRDTMKPRSKSAMAHSFDTLVQVMLRRHFHRDQRVTFQVSKTFDVRYNVFDRTVLLTHGDRMGSRGGQGFVGPAATILRGVQKVFMEQAALGFHIDTVAHGHFHYPMQLPFLLSNGCMPGYSEYAKTNRMRPTPPQQLLTYHHPERGVVDYKPIILA
jgi:hypothetical protein